MVRYGLGAGLLALSCLAGPCRAQGRDAGVGPDVARAVTELIVRALRKPDARVGALRPGRAGAVCGTVDVTNRMGAFTGPRGFVADPAAGFAGRLPDEPEIRNPGSMPEYRAMERARTLYAENCAAP